MGAPPGARPKNVRRRRVLAALAMIAAAISCGGGTPLWAQESAQAGDSGPPAIGDTLRQPRLARDRSRVPGIVELDITAAPARLRLLPGGPLVDAYAYNGSIPGPTIEAREGDSVLIHFRNELPEPTTVHWHGIHLPARADGSPLYPVPPGGGQLYAFRIPVGTAGTYWYHPHPDMRTTRQVALGLYGAFIVRPRQDPLAGVPERLLVLSDNRLAADGAVAFAAPGSTEESIDLENGREGNLLFVNGQLLPTIRMRPGEVERWRLVNASGARVYRLSLEGRALLQVGTDGGLFERPVEVSDLLLANSERAEVLVRGDSAGRTVLQDLPYDRYSPQTRPADWDSVRPLLTLEVTGQPATSPVAIPAVLRRIPAIDTSHVARRRLVVLSQGLINGRRMDLNRVDFEGRIGTTEIWTIQNVVTMDHPFHLHGFRFQVLDRDGVPEPFRSWRDSVNVPKHSSVRIAVAFTDYAGKWMYHCHILTHEDEGMMGVLQLR